MDALPPRSGAPTLIGLFFLLIVGLPIIGYIFSGSPRQPNPNVARTTLLQSQPSAAVNPVASAAAPVEAKPLPRKTQPIIQPIVPAQTNRIWMSASGSHTTIATLQDVIGPFAILQRENNPTTISVAAVKLSEDDRNYLAEQPKRRAIVGKVIEVFDGDSIAVQGDSSYRVRLAGIDAPENVQISYDKSKNSLAEKIYQKTVRVEWTNKNENNEIIGLVILDDRWINKEQVDLGWAWQFGDSPILLQAEAKAKEARLGLWADDHPVAPWEYQPPQVLATTSATEPPTLDLFKRSTNGATAGSPSSSGSQRPAPQWGEIPRDTREKTVHVSGYYRKDGTYVRPHYRRPPRR